MVTVQTKFQILNEYKQGHTATELSEQYGVSLRSIFGWIKQFDGSIESLIDGRVNNRRERLKVTPAIEELLVQLRTEKMGYKRISWRLKRKHGVMISPSAVKHWLKKHNMAGYRKKRKGRHRPDRTKKLPNQLWRLDLKEFRIKGVGKTYDYVGIDDCTRTLFANGYKHKNADNAIDFVKQLIKKHGPITEIRVDNGTQFVYLLKRKYKKRKLRKKTRRKTNKFGQFCKTQGIKLTFIPFGQPNKNAKIERANRTIKEELITRQRFRNLKGFNKKQTNWLLFYNDDREHGGLAGETPTDCWKRIKKQSHNKTMKSCKHQ
jgi:transposase InsO family protein